MDLLLQALLLGIVEGVTEFLPISSTAHLILVGELLGFHGPAGKTFEIVIQLGAILAVCVVYWRRLWGAAIHVTTQPSARHFVRNVIVGVLPALVIGAVAYKYIKVMLDHPAVSAVSLIVGGFLILAIERLVKKGRFFAVEDFPLPLAVKIGFCQCLAMIPGVSRAGATIMGAMVLGVDRKAAAEYSFFLAIPTMLAATVYSLWKARAELSFDGFALIAGGFIVAFLSALIVVKGFIAFISRHGFAPFAWYRIVFGAVMLAVLFVK
ncbi:MAG: undecaprenyl-diphosphate phosphatase [Magnetospirillum sp.]|nr:undecaprenyl-diphosphate phosphatase [Magnetospirillum sp.]